MNSKLNSKLLNQLRKKANEAEYGVLTDFDREEAIDLARLQEIEQKREINGDYPYPCIDNTNINELIIKA